MTIEQLLDKISGPASSEEFDKKEPFDVLVVGGGPEEAAQLFMLLVREFVQVWSLKLSGQVMETVGIENMIGTPYTEGPKLMAQVEEHAKKYPIDIMKNQREKHREKGFD